MNTSFLSSLTPSREALERQPRRLAPGVRWQLACISAATALQLAACAATEPAPTPSPQGASVVVGPDGRRVQLYCLGRGSPTIVLEAGMAGWSTDWAKVQEPLAAHSRTCAYDRAGYGASDPLTDEQQPTPQADLEQLLASSALTGPLVLVGHSMGGLLVADYARRHPERVAGLVLVDAVHRQQDVDDHSTVHSGEYVAQRHALGRLARWAVWLAPTGILRLSGTSANLVAARLPEPARTRALATAWSPRAYETLHKENAGFDGWLAQARQSAALPTVPSAVLSSTQARDFPPGFDTPGMQLLWHWRQNQLAKELGVQAQTIAASGHYVHVDQPAAVTAAVVRVLQQTQTGAATQRPAAVSD